MLKQLDVVIAFSVIMLLLSLVVTAIVQAVSALLDLRGQNLVKAVGVLLEQADPRLKAHAQTVAAALVTHPSVATGWRAFGRPTAKALQSQEVVRLLESLASPDDASLDQAPAAKAALKKLLQETVSPATLQDLEALVQANNALDALFPNYAALTKAFEEQAHATFTRAMAKGRDLAQNVDAWFDTVMNRSSERFAAQARYYTIGFSAVLAFGLGVDSLDILNQLRNDGTARDRIVAQTQAALDLAQEALERQPTAIALGAVVSAHPEQTEAIGKATAGAAPACSDIAQKLEGDPQTRALADEFERGCEQASEQYLAGLGERFKRLGALLAGSDLRIFNPPGVPFGGARLIGMLMTVVFLSLGSPFWYNALRQLANLRPMIAGKVEAKPAAGAGAAAAPAAKS